MSGERLLADIAISAHSREPEAESEIDMDLMSQDTRLKKAVEQTRTRTNRRGADDVGLWLSCLPYR
jgi:hypothetical protein